MAELTHKLSVKVDPEFSALLTQVIDELQAAREHNEILGDRIATLECEVQVLKGEWNGD